MVGGKKGDDCTLDVSNRESIRDNHLEVSSDESTTFSPNFNNRIEEMDLSHIDSSESPSEETSPPNRSSSPPPEVNTEEPPKIPPSPRYIHKSQTEHLLGIPSMAPTVTRSSTDIYREKSKGSNLFEKSFLKVSIREGNEITYPGVDGKIRFLSSAKCFFFN